MNGLLDFCKEIMLGYECGLYERMKQQNRLGLLNKKEIKYELLLFNVEFMNRMYKNLVLKNDPEIVSRFDAFKSLYSFNHNSLCFLNIIFMILNQVIESIVRTNLDTIHYDNYVEAIDRQLNRIFASINLQVLLDHDCDLEDKDMDPNAKVFTYEIITKN
jgi:hypothetical protein